MVLEDSRQVGVKSQLMPTSALEAAEEFIREYDFNFWERHSEQELRYFINGIASAMLPLTKSAHLIDQGLHRHRT